jgi:hypothetical protein
MNPLSNRQQSDTSLSINDLSQSCLGTADSRSDHPQRHPAAGCSALGHPWYHLVGHQVSHRAWCGESVSGVVSCAFVSAALFRLLRFLFLSEHKVSHPAGEHKVSHPAHNFNQSINVTQSPNLVVLTQGRSSHNQLFYLLRLCLETDLGQQQQ